MRRGAPKPLGLQNGKIPNRAITASSSYNRYFAPWLARLKRAKQGRYAGGWAAKVNNRQQWLQVRFKRAKKVVAVAIQGRQDFNQWVKLFSLSYSSDGVYFAKYKKNGRTKVCKSYVKERSCLSLLWFKVHLDTAFRHPCPVSSSGVIQRRYMIAYTLTHRGLEW